MHHHLRSTLWLVALVAGLNAVAQPREYSNTDEAISALFPGQKLAEWDRTAGDFNGDGIEDLALIITLFYDNEPMQTRLVVLAGSPGGRYSTMSASSRYCNAQKFFGLQANGSSLFVTEVHKADADGSTTNTLHFRFNKKLADLELIGRENIYESLHDKSYGRTSVNYPAGMTIVYERIRGRIKVKERSRSNAPPLAKLNGFDCDKYFYAKPY
jgi:hypothetical protein